MKKKQPNLHQLKSLDRSHYAQFLLTDVVCHPLGLQSRDPTEDSPHADRQSFSHRVKT